MPDVQLVIFYSTTSIGSVLLTWGEELPSGYKSWSWRNTPDGDKVGSWNWVRGYTPPFAYDNGAFSPVRFASQWSIVMSAGSYTNDDDTILNPGASIYEPYLMITSVGWDTDPNNPVQPLQGSWFMRLDERGRQGWGPDGGSGVALFKPATATDPDTNQPQPRRWPPSGNQRIEWIAVLGKPNSMGVDWARLDYDPYLTMPDPAKPKSGGTKPLPNFVPINPSRGRRTPGLNQAVDGGKGSAPPAPVWKPPILRAGPAPPPAKPPR
jgi:hypothetical protein